MGFSPRGLRWLIGLGVTAVMLNTTRPAQAIELYLRDTTLADALRSLERLEPDLQYLALPATEATAGVTLNGPLWSVMERLAAAFGCEATDYCGLWVIAPRPAEPTNRFAWQQQLGEARSAVFDELYLDRSGAAQARHVRAALAEWEEANRDPVPDGPTEYALPLPADSEPYRVVGHWLALEAARELADVPVPVPLAFGLGVGAFGPRRMLQIRFPLADEVGAHDLCDLSEPANLRGARSMADVCAPRTTTSRIAASMRSRFLGEPITWHGSTAIDDMLSAALRRVSATGRADERLAGRTVHGRLRDAPLWVVLDALAAGVGGIWTPPVDSERYSIVPRDDSTFSIAYRDTRLPVRLAQVVAERDDYTTRTALGQWLWQLLAEDERQRLLEGVELSLDELSPPVRSACRMAFEFILARAVKRLAAAFDHATAGRVSLWLLRHGDRFAVRCRLAEDDDSMTQNRTIYPAIYPADDPDAYRAALADLVELLSHGHLRQPRSYPRLPLHQLTETEPDSGPGYRLLAGPL